MNYFGLLLIPFKRKNDTKLIFSLFITISLLNDYQT